MQAEISPTEGLQAMVQLATRNLGRRLAAVLILLTR
jgi:hypothetical protein